MFFLFLSRHKKIISLAFFFYFLLWLYGTYSLSVIGEVGPGGIKRIVAIYESFYTRDAMTYAMSGFPLSPQTSGLFLSFVGGLLVCISSALLSQKKQVFIGHLSISSIMVHNLIYDF